MAWALRAYVDVMWVPEGAGFVTVMPVGGLGNEPGYGAAQAAGPVGNAQTLRLQVAEPVTGTTGISSSTLSTNLGTAAAQLGTDLTTALQSGLAASGATNLSIILGWATGNP